MLAGHGEAEESEGGEENGQAAEVGGEAGEEERLLEEDMKEEAAEEDEEEAAEAHLGAVVTTPEAETALAPTVPVKGAGASLAPPSLRLLLLEAGLQLCSFQWAACNASARTHWLTPSH